jgi:hypothetical protein
MQAKATLVQFTLNQTEACLRLDLRNADTGLLPRAELESVLVAVERCRGAQANGYLAPKEVSITILVPVTSCEASPQATSRPAPGSGRGRRPQGWRARRYH